MGTHGERFLHDLTAFEALLRGEARVHSYHCVPSSCSLFTQDVEECAPAGVQNAFSEGMILHHVEHLKLLNGNHLVLFSVLFGRLILKITALTRDLEMGLSRATSSFTAAMTALLTPAQLTLLASQGALRGAIEARVLHRVALTIGEKGLETNVNTDIRMLTDVGKMFRSRFGFTHDESVPGEPSWACPRSGDAA